MCLIDDCDNVVTVLSEADPVARQPHRCSECGRAIRPGERYHVDRIVLDGDFFAHKCCRHCLICRAWLEKECGGWIYAGVWEDISDHAESGQYSWGVRALHVGMQRMWTRWDGTLWRVPTVPPSTHERERTP